MSISIIWYINANLITDLKDPARRRHPFLSISIIDQEANSLNHFESDDKGGDAMFLKIYSVYKNQSNDGDGVVFLKSVNSKYPNDPKKHEIFLIILKMTP